MVAVSSQAQRRAYDGVEIQAPITIPKTDADIQLLILGWSILVSV